MPRRHEHIPLSLSLRQHVILDDRQAGAVAVLVAQTLEDPLRRVPLLPRPALTLFQDPVAVPVSGSSFGRAGGRLRRYPGGTENDSIFATVRGSIPKRRAASRLLIPSIRTAKRTFAKSSTPFIPGRLRSTQRASCRRVFTPAQPDSPAASLRDFVSAAYSIACN